MYGMALVISYTEEVFYNQFCHIENIKSKIAANKDTWRSQSCLEKVKYLEQKKKEYLIVLSFFFSLVVCVGWVLGKYGHPNYNC